TLEVASVELDHRILKRWAIAAFTDVGGALDDFSLSVRRDALNQGVGAGIRWLSPIGLIRIDGAFGVTQPGAPFHIHFSMGPDLLGRDCSSSVWCSRSSCRSWWVQDWFGSRSRAGWSPGD